MLQESHRAEIIQIDSAHAAELKKVRAESKEADSQSMMLQREVLILKDKVEKVRRER